MTILNSPWTLGVLGLVICWLLFVGWQRTKHLYKPPTVGHPVGMPTPTDTIEPFVIEPALVPYKCGHEYAVNFGHEFYGIRMAVHPERLAHREQCGDCMLPDLRADVIRCGSCGHAIIPNQSVAVYPDDGKCNPAWSTRTPDGKGVLGCMRKACCPSADHFGGYWTMDGFVDKVDPLEQAVISAAMASGKPVMGTVDADGNLHITTIETKAPEAETEKDDRN